jgi:orotate phosphoribosyltransferase
MGLPFVYVRSPKKTWQTKSSGGFYKGQNVVVVEDLISTGNSSLQAVEALRQAGANVSMAAIFIWVCCFGRKF